MRISKHKIIASPVILFMHEARCFAPSTTAWRETVQVNIWVKEAGVKLEKK